MRVIVVDTETTGLDPWQNELLQVSIIDYNANILFDEYIRPKREKSWREAELINGISPDMVSECLAIDKYRNEIQNIFNNADRIVGYNLDFDMAFLKNAGIYLPECEYFDVMLEFAPIYGEWSEYFDDYKWQKLVVCADYYKYEWRDPVHNALADCRATLHCYKCMIDDMQKYKYNIYGDGWD